MKTVHSIIRTAETALRQGDFMKRWIPCNVIRPVEIKALYTAFKITFDSKFSFAGESHNFYELICVIGGTIGIASNMDVYKVAAGNMVIHKPMEFHRIWSEDQTSPTIIIISFDAEITPVIPGTVYSLTSDESDAYEEIFNLIQSSCEISARRVTGILPDRHAELETAVNNLENLLLKVLLANGRHFIETSSAEYAIKYRDIMKYLIENVNIQLSISDVARECGMSASGAKQIFHKYTGQGIMHYFRDLKAKEAITLLNSGLSVKETSLRLGFTDQNYFSTFFKKVTGKSPRSYISGA